MSLKPWRHFSVYLNPQLDLMLGPGPLGIHSEAFGSVKAKAINRVSSCEFLACLASGCKWANVFDPPDSLKDIF